MRRGYLFVVVFVAYFRVSDFISRENVGGGYAFYVFFHFFIFLSPSYSLFPNPPESYDQTAPPFNPALSATPHPCMPEIIVSNISLIVEMTRRRRARELKSLQNLR